ncbi:MAG: cbb3-type cytochrome c oxidase subunit II [Bdellovibrionales bacterium]|nr:cbb3-type cytochrome c oxidase subunit II [Bdellovibrionales bacterium]
MKMIEKFSGIFLIAGLFLFGGAVLSLGLVPAFMVDRLNPRQGLPTEVPENFKAYYASAGDYQKALLRGRDMYIREACWHCHSQFVRPVSNENLMYGPVSTPAEYQTVLHLPQLFGTRRVGPDLSREAGRRPNDWQFAHLYRPTNVVPDSVMPAYTWYFKATADGGAEPTADGIALVAYIQNLGMAFRESNERAAVAEEITFPPSE